MAEETTKPQDNKEELNIETLEGKIITDADISLPTINDFYYNDLVGNNYTNMIKQNIFYLENPPEDEDWMGFSQDKSLLTVKAKKSAFKLSAPFIATNSVTCSNVILDLSGDNISWPGASDVTDVINSLKKSSAFDAYRYKNGDKEVENDSTWIKDAAELRLLFFNPPSIPSWNTEIVQWYEGDHGFIKKKYKDVIAENIYTYSKSPFPYSITYKNDGATAVIDTSNGAYNKDGYKYKDDDELYFMRDKGTSQYRQVIPLNKISGSDQEERQILMLNQDNSKNTNIVKAYKARDLLVETINKATDIRIVFDVNSIKAQDQSVYKRQYPILYEPNLQPEGTILPNPATRIINNYNKLRNSLHDDSWFASVGYNPYGLDAYKRAHGVVYVKVPNPNKNEKSTKENNDYVWWNLNKYIIANLEEDSEDTNTAGDNERYHVNYGPTELKPYTYDYVNNQYVDGFWKNTLDNDKKRYLVQQAIFAKNSDLLPNIAGEDLAKVLYEWTVTLGDVTLFVPPESIRVISQTATQRAHLMRSRGSIAKGQEKSHQFFELNLYFNDERGINGVEYEQPTPNYNESKKTGKKIVYKMNGLRALIAEMKFVPFVPVINKLLNETFNVYAVCFESFNISTVQGFPKLLKAQLQLSKFNYQVYMPEVPEVGYSDNEITYNPFSCCIDYDVLRYYYQKPILLGDLLDYKLNTKEPGINGADNRITVNSLEFYTRTIFSNRTALLPCHFDDPTIRVYIANENRLKELDEIKKAEAARVMDPYNSYSIDGSDNSYAASNFIPNETEIRLINDASTFVENVNIPEIYEKYVSAIRELAANLHKPGTYGKFIIEEDPAAKNQPVNYIMADGEKYVSDDKEVAKAFLEKYFYTPMFEEIKSKTNNLHGVYGDRLISAVEFKNNKIYISFNTGRYCASDSSFKNAQYEAASYIKSSENVAIEPKKIFSDRQIILNLPSVGIQDLSTGIAGYTSLGSSILGHAIRNFSESSKNGKMGMDIDENAGLLFTYWCKNIALPIAESNERISELKQSIDLETVHSLKYDLIVGTDMENDFQTAPADKNAIVKEFSATLSNTYARTSVSNIDGTAPQYMGGQDIHLSWTLETTNAEIARTFKNLPELTSYLTRTYRHVLPTYPIKIDSDFTRMLGIIEVMIESVNVETVFGMPGLYRINVIATSVDRTLRNKEALKKLDAKNENLSWSRLREYKQTVNIREREELNKELCKAEIYPDLELPTCTELGELGFRYIRYKDKERNENNFYVDPDFYFIYPSITFGRALLEALQFSFSTNPDTSGMEQNIVDRTGSKYKVDIKSKGVDLSSGNEMANRQREEVRIINMKKSEDDPVYHLNGSYASIFKIPFGSWNIGAKIKCSFMEPYYLRELWKAENKNTESRCRIEVNSNTTEQQIEEAKKKVDGKYAWIDIYDTDKNELRSSTINFNFKSDEDKISANIEEHHKLAKELKEWLKTNKPSVPEGSSPNKKIIRTKQAVSSLPMVGSYIIAHVLDVPKWEDADRVANQLDMLDEVKKYLSNAAIQNILKKAHILGNKFSSTDLEDIAHIIVAAGDACSGKAEYNNAGNQTKSKDWMADIQHMAVETERARELNSNFVDSFGLFKIKRYKEADFAQVLPNSELAEFTEKLKSFSSEEKTNRSSCYLLDPYYRFAPIDEQKKYLENCVSNPKFASIAFTRIVLWYLAILIEENIYPSVEYDIKREDCLNVVTSDQKARKTINQLANDGDIKGRMSTATAKKQTEQKETQAETNKKIDEATSKDYKGQDASSLLSGMKAFVAKNGPSLDAGKFFMATTFAMLGDSFKSSKLFNAVKNRRYDELNNIAKALTSAKFAKRNDADPLSSDNAVLMRKYFLALQGHKILTENDIVGYIQNFSPSNQFLTQYNAKLALLACSNPARYMRDSFYDMVRNDYRGRMLRAFPTFYMIFIDEGRELGLFRLHDNFYNINAVSEIQVVKSRLLAADTCIITLSNMFQTFTTNDEDCTVNYRGGLGDLWESFWSPKKAATRAEMLRAAADKINRAKLQPGIRIHVRLGYGANAKDLPIVFNGTIAEIQGNELVKVVAQGDGVELCNPIYEEGSSESVINKDIRFTMDSSMVGAPAKDILQSFLTAKGGVIAAMLRGHYNSSSSTEYSKTNAIENDQLKEDIDSINKQKSKMLVTVEAGDNLTGAINRYLLKKFQDNPFGLFHFGDHSYKETFPQGEPAQNLYEVTTSSEAIDPKDIKDKVDLDAYYKNIGKYDKMPGLSQDNFAYFGDRRLDLNSEIQYDMGPWTYFNPKNNLPYLSFKPFGKTIWEIMHICQSVNPDFVTGVRDFEFRSTIFLGKPHYYYAYEYKKTPYGSYIEKRKPYQQWHLYHSSYDIIKNGITASSTNIKTNAVGLYEVEGTSSVQKTDPIWVDQDIYPEYQKSCIINTNYYGRSGATGGFARAGAVAGGAAAGAKAGSFFGPYVAAGAGLLGSIAGYFGLDAVSYLTNSVADKHMSTMFDQTGPIRSHNKLAFLMTVNGLKDSMRQMYQGYLTVIGDPSVKPQDRILIDDAYEDVDGMCEVREVIHQLSPNTGFTTTITPDLISAYEPRSEMIKQNAIMHYISNISIALGITAFNLLYLNRMESLGFRRAYSFAIKRLIHTQEGKTLLRNIRVIDPTSTRTAFLKITNPADLYARLKQINDGITTLKNTAGISAKTAQAIADIEASAIWKTTQKKAFQKIATSPFLKSSLGAVSRFGGYLFILAEIAIAMIDSSMYKMIRNSQTLTIFPLKKFGKSFAAGVDGSEGLIYGTMSYNRPGIMESFYARFFSGEYAKDAGTGEKIWATILSTIASSDINAAATKYQRDSEFVKNVVFNPYEIKENQLNSTFTNHYLHRIVYQPKTGYAAALRPRIVYGRDKATRTAIKDVVQDKTCIENVQDWLTNPNLRNLYYLKNDKDMERLFKAGFLKTFQDQIINDSKFKEKDAKIQEYTIRDDQNKQLVIYGYKRGETRKVTNNGKTEEKTVTLLDVPYLTWDAKLILKEICDFVIFSLYGYPDSEEIMQKTKDTYIVLTSALKVGSENYLYKSGYHFIIQGTGTLKEKGDKSLRSLIQKYYDKEKERLKADGLDISPCFMIDDKGPKGDNEVGIIVFPAAPNGNSIKETKKQKSK